MKKILAFILCIILTLSAVSAMAETKVELPKTVGELSNLPEANVEEFAKMKTKDDGHTIKVTLSKAVDSIQANWLGIDETPEDLTVGEDLTTTVSHEGHKYQLGTKWVSGEHPTLKLYYDGEFFEDEADRNKAIAHARDVEIPGKFRNAVNEYMDSEGYGDKVETIIEVDSVKWHVGFWYGDEYHSRTFPPDVTEEEIEEYVKRFDDAWYEKYGYALKTIVGHQFKPSRGQPNYAYLTKQGDAMVVYGRAGDIRYFERTVEGSSFFGQGQGKATVTFQKGKKHWYIEKIREEYESGDIQAVTATYYSTGKLRKTEVEDRKAE